MKKNLPLERWSWWALLAFASTAVVSIVWQHLIWVSILLWLLAWSLGRVRPQWPMGALGAATLLLLATFYAGALFGVDPGKSFQSVHRTLTLLVFFLVGAMGLGLAPVKKLLVCFTYGAAFCGLWGVIQHLFLDKNRVASFGGHIMIFGGLLMTALVIQAFILYREPRKVWHWAVLGVMGLALIFNATRGAWVALAVGLLGLIWCYRRKWLLPALGLAVASYFILPSHYQLKVRSIWDPTIRRTNTERVLMWKAGWAMSQDRPLFGFGHDNIFQTYPSYRLPGTKEKSVPHLHNNFVQVLVQNGWVGLLAYLGWIAAYLGTALRRRRWPKEAGDWNLVLTWAFVGGLVWGLTEWTFSHQFMNVQFFLMGLQANLWRQGRIA
jgi:O-antigen ligase